MRLGDQLVHHAHVLLAHAKAAKVERQRTLVQDSHHHALAVDGGHGAHAEVHLATFVAQGDVTVLRHIALGDVHLRHDLDAADDRGLQVLGRAGLLDQHAVHAVLHLQFALEGLDVDVAGALLDGLEDHQVHQVHQRRLFRHAVHVVGLDRIQVVLRVGARQFAIARQALRHARGRHAIGAAHQLTEGFRRNTHAHERHARHGAGFVDGVQIERIRQRDAQSATFGGQGHHPQSNRHIRGNQSHRMRLGWHRLLQPFEADRLAAFAR